MNPKRFELKIPQDLLARIEMAARDYFKSPLNHTSKKPELTSPILKLIEKGLEKIAESPYTDTNQIHTDKLNELIDERVKEQLSVYNLDDIRTKIALLEQVVFKLSGGTLTKLVLNPDKKLIEPEANILELFTNQSLKGQTLSVGHPDKERVESTNNETEDKTTQTPGENPDHHDTLLNKTRRSDNSTEGESILSYIDVALDRVESIYNTDITTPETENIVESNLQAPCLDEPVKDTDIISANVTQHTSQTNEGGKCPDFIQPLDGEEEDTFKDDSNESSQTLDVLNPDKQTLATQVETSQDKPNAHGAKVTLKGAWKHALVSGFTGTLEEFRHLFKNKGDENYGVKILYFSGGSSSRNYELLR